jgi:hypothetical protein
MTFLYRAIILFILFFNLSGISAQQSKITLANVYGSDPSLYNGRFYIYFLPLNTKGNQYFSDPRFEKGSVTIRGVTYNDLELNYDIYNQQLILQYQDILGATSLIIISDAWLESFSFRGLNFEIISSQDTLKSIFQVLGSGRYLIFYHWIKELNLESFQGSQNHMFSEAKKEMNVYNGDQILRYRNNKSLYSLFEPDKRTAIKEYIRKNKIHVKKANDLVMTGLINYCNSLFSK